MSAPEEPHAPPKRSRNQYTERADASHAAEGATPANSGRNADGTFAKGNSANPAGKPKGTLHRTTRAILEMMQGEAEAVTRKAIDLALAGDSVALRLVMERLLSPVRERPVNVALPRINAASDLIAAASALTDAVASGDITPGEAASLSTLVGNVSKAIETIELSERLAKIEERLAAQGQSNARVNAMPSRINIRDRLEQLEARIAPKGRVFVLHIDDGLPHAEQVAAFKTENRVKQHDHLVVVAFS